MECENCWLTCSVDQPGSQVTLKYDGTVKGGSHLTEVEIVTGQGKETLLAGELLTFDFDTIESVIGIGQSC